AKTDSTLPNVVPTTLSLLPWPYFLYQPLLHPLPPINTFSPLFPIPNQIFAGIPLLLPTTIFFNMRKKPYLSLTLIPTLPFLILTITPPYQKLFHHNPKIPFLSHPKVFQTPLDQGRILAPPENLAQI
ncbi:carbon starvation CstA family protein, partial [Bacillus mycoides]|uniref:carbon starvation CstA family protein n=1 Tax=Bacillus mycoides TaxID=1405 RepID=UPI002353AB8B